MRKLPLALIALAAGAGAAYYLDPRHGARRRDQTLQAMLGWREAVERRAADGTGSLRERLAGLGDSLRLLMDRWSERQSREDELAEEAALEPLSFPPRSLEAAPSRGGVLTALAIAAPVALAVGAAVVKQRHEGDWLH